jgi:hypothetical protein
MFKNCLKGSCVVYSVDSKHGMGQSCWWCCCDAQGWLTARPARSATSRCSSAVVIGSELRAVTLQLIEKRLCQDLLFQETGF